MSARSNVVLPAPLRPMRPHISPSASSSDALRMTGTTPIVTSRSQTLSMAFAVRLRAADECLHARIREREGWRAVGDHGAVVEGEYAIGEPRHDLYVVLDEQHRQSPALEGPQHHVHQPRPF